MQDVAGDELTVPSGHRWQALAPDTSENLPFGHGNGSGELAPAVQKNPGIARQTPVHVGEVSPGVAPKVPAGHGVHDSAPS